MKYHKAPSENYTLPIYNMHLHTYIVIIPHCAHTRNTFAAATVTAADNTSSVYPLQT